MRVQRAGRTEGPFPEIAEVLGIDTDLILGAHEVGGQMEVLYSPTREEAESKILGIILRRGGDGVLRKATSPVEVPEMVEHLKRLGDDLSQ